MENYEINHELNRYDDIEGTDFDGLMEKMMETIFIIKI